MDTKRDQDGLREVVNEECAFRPAAGSSSSAVEPAGRGGRLRALQVDGFVCRSTGARFACRIPERQVADREPRPAKKIPLRGLPVPLGQASFGGGAEGVTGRVGAACPGCFATIR